VFGGIALGGGTLGLSRPLFSAPDRNAMLNTIERIDANAEELHPVPPAPKQPTPSVMEYLAGNVTAHHFDAAWQFCEWFEKNQDQISDLLWAIYFLGSHSPKDLDKLVEQGFEDHFAQAHKEGRVRP
jgi:hypothetical protein